MLFSPSVSIHNKYLNYTNTEMTEKDIEESENLEKTVEIESNVNLEQEKEDKKENQN